MSVPSEKVGEGAHPRGVLGVLDRASLLAMAAAVGLMLQPWWTHGLRVGFFLTAAFTLVQITVSHFTAEEEG